MKITEVTLPLDRAMIVEALSKENNTGFIAEDLANIVESHESDWSDAMTADEMLAEMDAMEAAYDAEHGTAE